ncbi:hypothetical protein P7K49_039686, partial [Saguinus oedipus]
MCCLRELGLFEYLLQCPAQLGGSLFTICLLGILPASVSLPCFREAPFYCGALCPVGGVSLLWLVASATSGCIRSG